MPKQFVPSVPKTKISGSTHAPWGAKAIQFGWVAVSGKAGDVIFVDASEIPVKYGAANLGTFFQSSAAASVAFTLCHPEEACNPDPAVQAGVIWGSTKAVPSGDIQGVTFGYTAIRVTFSAAGVVYIGAV